MGKSVMLSILPKWCVKIICGEKTCEVRKTKPKLMPPFKCYVYASKGKERLIEVMKDGYMNFGEVYHGKNVFITVSEEGRYEIETQKIIGEFICDDIVEVTPDTLGMAVKTGILTGYSTGMQIDEFLKYMGERCYLWHISGFKAYPRFSEKPLSDFRSFGAEDGHRMKIPPQSWCYVEEIEDERE